MGFQTQRFEGKRGKTKVRTFKEEMGGFEKRGLDGKVLGSKRKP